MTVPSAPETLIEPPRSTGDVQQDYPLMLDWFYSAYQNIVQAVAYMKAVREELVDINTAAIATNDALLAAQVKGSVTVSNTSTGETVTFDDEQADADYIIIMQAISISGAPAAASLVISSKTYATTGFSFTVAQAPGAGTSVTYEWQIMRTA